MAARTPRKEPTVRPCEVKRPNTLVIRLKEKGNNDVLQVALQDLKKRDLRNRGLKMPEAVNSKSRMYVTWHLQFTTWKTAKTGFEIAGTWQRRPFVISPWKGSVFVGGWLPDHASTWTSCQDSDNLPLLYVHRETACYSGLHTHTFFHRRCSTQNFCTQKLLHRENLRGQKTLHALYTKFLAQRCMYPSAFPSLLPFSSLSPS
jgi:hypothetical protein